jgi:hypothetical protein
VTALAEQISDDQCSSRCCIDSSVRASNSPPFVPSMTAPITVTDSFTDLLAPAGVYEDRDNIFG